MSKKRNVFYESCSYNYCAQVTCWDTRMKINTNNNKQIRDIILDDDDIKHFFKRR